MENEVELYKIPIEQMTSLQLARRIIEVLQGSIDEGAITLPDWALVKFLDRWNARATTPSPLTAEVSDLLADIRCALETLPKDSLGTQGGWSYRDELIANINKARASELMAVATGVEAKDEVSVESAFAELRQMFPDAKTVEVRFDSHARYFAGLNSPPPLGRLNPEKEN